MDDQLLKYDEESVPRDDHTNPRVSGQLCLLLEFRGGIASHVHRDDP